MLNTSERDWIEDRILTLLDDIIKTSDDERAVEIRGLLEKLKDIDPVNPLERE